MGLPNIVVEFLTKANTAVTRSERGIVCLVLNDTTKSDNTLYEYKSVLDVKEEDWTVDNAKVLKDAFIDGPLKVYAVRIKTEESFTDIKATLDGIKINWLAYIDETQTDVVSYVKERNLKGGSALVKAVVSGQDADDTHIVNFTNTSVKRKSDAESIEGYLYLGRIAGMLAALPMDRSATYFELTDLESVTDSEDTDTAVDNGEFVLFNDYGTVKVARAVNSATTVEKEDLKKIAIIEGMDLIREDIMETFKNQYIGRYKNNLDNQMVFVAAVNTYFRQLGLEDILDDEFDNLAEINVEKQRTEWANSGTTEALDWDDEKVKQMTFKSYVYLKGSVKLLDAMEDLTFDIYMN